MADTQASFGSSDSLPVPLPAPPDHGALPDTSPSAALASNPVSEPASLVVPTPAVSPVPSPVSSQGAPPIGAVVPAPLPASDATSVLPSGTIDSSPPTALPYNAWSEAPVVLGVAFGVAVLIALILLGCFGLHRRRQWKKRNLDIPSMSETETLISRRSADYNIPPKHDKRFDLENPAPVYLGKGQGRPIFPHLKTLHLLSHSGSIASTSTSTSTSAFANRSNREKRVYSTQPPIPSVSVTRDHPRTSLPDGFESYIYALRSPQLIDGMIAKRLSLVSNISTIRFARDSQAWALRRGSDCSLDRATVFDDDQHKEASPPLLGTSASSDSRRDSRRASQKPRRKPPPPPLPQLDIPAAHGRYEDYSDVQYQPTPLAPPPAQIRARSVTPTNSVVRRMASTESADTLIGGAMDPVRNGPPAPREYNRLAPSARPSQSILHSAVAKGKVSRQEAESVLGMRIAITP